ncbi:MULTISPECIES: DUF6421 family protein [unclassified Bartonella]|uniref:DUF6421 family protein n=1 Tax=unclassified Bartonella TaxID=2645622 RepID=UPI0035CF10F0
MKKSEALLSIVNLVDKFRMRQERDGSIKEPTSADNNMINELITLLNHHANILDGLSPKLLATISDDLHQWMISGLTTPPQFDNTLAAFKAPLPDAPLFFLAPMRATNGPDPEGFRLELVTGYRHETAYLADASKYTNNYLSPFQCIKMGIASRGFLEGNCIVLFPESVATAQKIVKQAFALFFSVNSLIFTISKQLWKLNVYSAVIVNSYSVNCIVETYLKKTFTMLAVCGAIIMTMHIILDRGHWIKIYI